MTEETEDDLKKAEEEPKEQSSGDRMITDDDINTLVQAYKMIHGDKFDEKAFRASAKQAQTAKESLNSLNPQKHIKEDNNGGTSWGVGGYPSFSGTYENGKYIGHGSNGEMIEVSSLKELNKMIAKSYKEKALKEGKQIFAGFNVSSEFPESEKEQKEIFAKEFINAGLGVEGDVPNDPKFWNDFKKEYLSNKENTEAEWNRLTSRVPPEYMGKEKQDEQTQTPQEQNRPAAEQSNPTQPTRAHDPQKRNRYLANKKRGLPMKGIRNRRSRSYSRQPSRSLSTGRDGR